MATNSVIHEKKYSVKRNEDDVEELYVNGVLTKAGVKRKIETFLSVAEPRKIITDFMYAKWMVITINGSSITQMVRECT